MPGFGGLTPERFAFRSGEGQPIQSIRQLSALQLVMGRRGRSGDYLNAWEASFGPVGEDGYLDGTLGHGRKADGILDSPRRWKAVVQRLHDKGYSDSGYNSYCLADP